MSEDWKRIQLFMLKNHSTIGDKAQTTVPKGFREHFGLAKGDSFVWELDEANGWIILKPVKQQAFRDAMDAAVENSMRDFEQGKAHVIKTKEDIARLREQLKSDHVGARTER